MEDELRLLRIDLAEAEAGAKEGRISVKEKLKEMGMRAAQQRISGDLSPGKNREDSL